MPNLPNVKEDPDLTRPYSMWDEAADRIKNDIKTHEEWLRKQASYVDPQGVMWFQDNQSYVPGYGARYPSGNPADGISFEPNPVKSALPGRYMPAEQPVPATLGNRYTIPRPEEKLGEAMPDTPELMLLKMAIKAGVI